jgi:hypothetical protein
MAIPFSQRARLEVEPAGLCRHHGNLPVQMASQCASSPTVPGHGHILNHIIRLTYLIDSSNIHVMLLEALLKTKRCSSESAWFLHVALMVEIFMDLFYGLPQSARRGQTDRTYQQCCLCWLNEFSIPQHITHHHMFITTAFT